MMRRVLLVFGLLAGLSIPCVAQTTGEQLWAGALSGVSPGEIVFSHDNALTSAEAVADSISGTLTWYGSSPTGHAAMPICGAPPGPTCQVVAVNTGSSNITFGPSPVSFTGTNGADWSVGTGTFQACTNYTLAPLAACAIYPVFTPSVNGPESATLVLTDTGGHQYTQALAGTGTSAASVVTISCNANLSTYINQSSPSGTIYVLAGSPAAPCNPYHVADWYNSNGALGPASNITIEGDCHDYVGRNTVLDGGQGSTTTNYALISAGPESGLGNDTASNVTLACVTVQNFSGPQYRPVPGGLCGANNTENWCAAVVISSGWLVTNITCQLSGGSCGMAVGTNPIWQNSLVQHNYHGGVHCQPHRSAVAGSYITIAGNEFNDNNLGNDSPQNDVGNLGKCIENNTGGGSQNTLIENNYVHDGNDTNAIWCDFCLRTSGTGYTYTVTGNTVVNNGVEGIRCEGASFDCVLTHNVIENNDRQNLALQDDVDLENDGYATVSDNFIESWSGLTNGPAGGLHIGDYNGTNNNFYNSLSNNTIYLTSSSSAQAFGEHGMNGDPGTGNTSNDNVFYTPVPSTDAHWDWNDPAYTGHTYGAYQPGWGQDLASAINAGVPPVVPAGCTVGPGCAGSGF